MLFARDPLRDVTVDREMLKREPGLPKRLRAEKALVILLTLLSLGAMLGVGALLAR